MLDVQPPVPWSEVIDSAADAVVLVDRDRVIRYANRAVQSMLGFEPADLVGRDYAVLIPERVHDVHLDHHRGFVAEPVARRMGTGRYLRAVRADGVEIDVDIGLAPIDGEEFLVAAFIRDVSATARQIERLDATNAIFRTALAGAGEPELARLGGRLGGDVVGAASSWCGLVDRGGEASIGAGAGPHADLLGALAVEPRVRPLDGSADGPPSKAFGVAEHAAGRLDGDLLVVSTDTDVGVGMMVFHRDPPRSFTPLDHEIARRFVDAMGVAFELVELRKRMVDLASIAEHDRIARDLHDSVIQHLFATALRLESLLTTLTGPTAERVGAAVADLDEVIGEVRAAIFDLHRPASGRTGLRAAVADEVDRFAEIVGTTPHLRFDGLVDAAVSAAVEHEIPVVVREALANVAQHAGARRVDVAVEANDGEIVVAVEDDGVGIGRELVHGDGLDNLSARAAMLGGSFAVRARPEGGTRAEWRIPATVGGELSSGSVPSSRRAP